MKETQLIQDGKMEKKYYTDERNVQIVIALLKAYGIKNIIASPGTTNMTFVISVSNDPWFKVWSSVDERSAAYLACGLAEEENSPVVLSCTGATASRNYMPGLTEAYYRKLPVLAITSTRGVEQIGHLHDQQIDRRTIPNDIANVSVHLPLVNNSKEERFCLIEASKAIFALRQRGGGPSHINLCTKCSNNFNIRDIENVIPINLYNAFSKNLPVIPQNARIGVFVGAHRLFTEEENEAIELFCSSHNAAVFCDHTSGYVGNYQVNFQIVSCQEQWKSELIDLDLCIHIGEVTGDQYKVKAKNVWRVSPDGIIRDSWGTLRNVFEMSEDVFFRLYSTDQCLNNDFLIKLLQEEKHIRQQIPMLPFSNIWMAQQMHSKLPHGCELHLGIYNSLRSWNFFRLDESIITKCNVGGFGIDGCMSTLIGASFSNPNKIYFGVLGDLAFFYDMNVLGNRHVGNNVRIMLVNNGKGTEFRNYSHPCYFVGDEADKYIAAAKHYGNKSPNLIKHYATDLGFEYFSASTKDEFLENLERFVTNQMTDKPIIFEVFTESSDESEALRSVLNIVSSPNHRIKTQIKNVIKSMVGQNLVDKVKSAIR